ncbi:hypothetical protein ACFUJY_29465 [Streptomyces sp. NPDC057249]|uniref:hypothetical protein n=1 Tax=Streptomyces sp. NPDC057249 TaxID=3346067 RepID=UPI0036459551
MRLVIEGGSAAFEEKLLALFAEHRDELTVETDREWTVERAKDFVRIATPPVRTLLNDVLHGGGYRAASDLRDMGRDLAGPSISLTKTLTKGVVDGLWPSGMPAPITADYGREKPQNKKVEGYRMAAELVPIFTVAAEG